MIPILLTRIKTSDGITLDGIHVRPAGKTKWALIWIHGLTSYFYSSPRLIEELSRSCSRNGIGYFKFSTRGHDVVVRGQGKKRFLGTVYEKFEECVHDIRAMIRHARRLGYRRVILAGHSTGANKVVYYLHKTGDRNVKGVIFLGAANDIVCEKKRVGKTQFEKNSRLARRLSRKDPLALFTSRGYLFTARRFVSLFSPGSAEDVFPYYDPRANWKALASIRAPLAVIFGARDECLDRPARELVKLFQQQALRTPSYTGIVVPGADHSFHGREKELTRHIAQWAKTVVLSKP